MLTFELRERRFAVELAFVREVLATTVVTPVPGAPPYVRGLCNARGTLSPVLDLGLLLLGAPARATRPGDPLVLLELAPQPWSDGQPVRAAIVADRVLGVVEPGADERQAQRVDVPQLVAVARAGVERAAGTRARASGVP
jgi:purine-binding chemotaxis protein CheW